MFNWNARCPEIVRIAGVPFLRLEPEKKKTPIRSRSTARLDNCQRTLLLRRVSLLILHRRDATLVDSACMYRFLLV